MTTQPIASATGPGPAVLQISDSAPPEMKQLWQSICQAMQPLVEEQAKDVKRCHQIGQQAALIKQHELHRYFRFGRWEDPPLDHLPFFPAPTAPGPSSP